MAGRNTKRTGILRQQQLAEKRLAKLEKEIKRKDKELEKLRKQLEDTGVYSPKSSEWTKSRRATVRRKVREYAEFLTPEYAFVALPKKELRQFAKQLDMIVTKKGVFYQLNGAKSAKLEYRKRAKEYVIKTTGEVKRGPKHGKKYTRVTPLTSPDALLDAENKLKKMAHGLGPRDKKEMLAFVVQERGGKKGYSRAVFSDINQVMKYLNQYKIKPGDRIEFFRHIQIVKTTSWQWFRDHPTKRSRKRRVK